MSQPSLRIVFAGTPDIAAACLAALLADRASVIAAYTQPDRPAGRGKKLQASAVKQLALRHGIPVLQPINFRDDADVDALAALQPDLMIVVAYGLLLPQRVLDIPRLGCINVHASLLPRWRGAAPIERAIEAGDRETGITTMQMDAGLDTGPMLHIASCPIHDDDTGSSLRERLTTLGATTLISTVHALQNGSLHATPQPDEGISYARKLHRDEACIDWHQPATVIARRIRAFNAANPCWTTLGEQRIKLWRAHAEAGQGIPGTVVRAESSGIRVACAEGVLCLDELQMPGARALPAGDILNGHKTLFVSGTRLGASA
ncbi:MAG TPA: methionyl-tRNA formyltransferase [Pseudomonadales bacterium]